MNGAGYAIVNEILSFCSNVNNVRNPICKSLAVTAATQRPPLSSILNLIARYSSGLELTQEESDLAFDEFAKITNFEPPKIENVLNEIKKLPTYLTISHVVFIYVPIIILAFIVFLILFLSCVISLLEFIVYTLLFMILLATFSFLYWASYNYYFNKMFNEFTDQAKIVNNLKNSFVKIIPGITAMSKKIEEINSQKEQEQ